jgi:hypothetical protein
MHKFFTSSFDASIYLQQPDQNAGRDELLEVGKLYYGSTKDIARTLIKFNSTQLSQSVAENIGTGSYSVFLNLKASKSEEIPLQYTLYANALSSSWIMGTGTKFDNITTDGVSWKYRDGQTKWVGYDTTGGTAVYPTGSNATTGSANAEGGVWYLTGSVSQSFDYETDDVRMDVTNLVKLWITGTGSIANNGLIIHHGLTNESDTLDYGVIKFFSKETGTIYEPKLELVWDDSRFLTGSLLPVTGSAQEGYKVVVSNLKNEYVTDTKAKIRLKGRDMYPSKSFGTTFSYDQVKYLPSGSTYYQIEDYITGEAIFPFGDYTKVSCDSTSNYFIMDLSTLPINRTYRLKIKIIESGISTFVDDKYIFEIVS